MRIILILLLLLTGFLNAFGQITITNSVFPMAGDTLVTEIDVAPDGIMVTAPGPDQQWMFDRLNGLFRASAEVKDASEGSVAQEFPSADLVLVFDTGIERYYRVRADRIEEIGYTGIDPVFSVIQLIAYYKQPYIIQRAPLNYGDMNMSTSELLFPYAYDDLPDSITSQFPLPISPDSVRLVLRVDREDQVDAWGTLEIPGGTYNVLREKRVEVRNSAVEAKVIGFGGWFDITSTIQTILPDSAVLENDTLISYNFFSDMSTEPIAVVTTSPDDEVIRVDFKSNDKTGTPVFTPSQGPLDIHVSPNPTLGRCVFEFENLPAGDYSLQVINILGVKIWEQEFEAFGDISLSADLSGLRKGTYLYSLKTGKGSTLKTKRLIILNP